MYKRQTLELHSVAPDLIPQDAPQTAWNRATNVAARNAENLRVFGDTPTLPTDKTPKVAEFLRVSPTVPYWVYANENGIWVHDGVTETAVTPAGWGSSGEATWTSCVLNGIVYINASDSDPVYWNGDPAQVCQPLPDWPQDGRCLALRAHKNFLLAIGFVSEGSQRVRWSDAAEAGTVPQFWTPAADNLAGFADLAPLSSPCLDGATMRDSFVVYKAESIWSFDFIGGNEVFRLRKMFAEHGLRATNGICAGPDGKHLFVADEGDVQITNGVDVQSVLDGRAQRSFYNSISQGLGVFAAAYLAREKLGVIAYSSSAASERADIALLYDFVSNDIGFRELRDVTCIAEGAAIRPVADENTWDGQTKSWNDTTRAWSRAVVPQTLDDVVIGGDFGFAVISDPDANDFWFGPVKTSMEKEGLSFGNAKTRKMISRVWPKMSGRNGDVVQIRIGGQEITGGPIALSPTVDFTIGQDTSVDTFAQGRFMYLQVSSEGGAPWRLGTVDVEFRPVGDF